MLWVSIAYAGDSGKPTNDLTKHVEVLGNPTRIKYPDGFYTYARNIWDMQVYDGLLYFGAGNSSNKGPAPNAGGGEVWVFDPTTEQFYVDFRTDEEQIDRFRVLNGTLYIPGHDPTDPWELGNYYRLENEGWRKYRNLPHAVHCYDLFSHHGKLFAALGTATRREFVLISKDGGRNWQGSNLKGRRAYSFFTIGNRLYVSLYRGIAAYDGKGFKEIVPGPWFNGYKGRDRFRLVARPVDFQGAAVYIGAVPFNDHQWKPFGLQVARSENDIQTIKISGEPRDLIVKNNILYVLCGVRESNRSDSVAIFIVTTKDLKNWSTLFSFQAPTFARSFEILDGDFYFGLGCEPNSLNAATGMILRVGK